MFLRSMRSTRTNKQAHKQTNVRCSKPDSAHRCGHGESVANRDGRRQGVEDLITGVIWPPQSHVWRPENKLNDRVSSRYLGLESDEWMGCMRTDRL
jgi:hypothetical protein